MKKMKHSITFDLFASVFALIITGCTTTPVDYGPQVGRVDATVAHDQFDSKGFAVGEVLEIVSYMMPRMMVNPFVMAAIDNSQGDLTKVPRVVVLPIKNNSNSRLNKGTFMNRFRSELNKQADGKLLFLARENMPELEAEMDLIGNQTVTTADFFLTGTVDGMTSRGAVGGTKESYLYSFRLIDVKTQGIIWEDNYTVSKVAMERLINR